VGGGVGGTGATYLLGRPSITWATPPAISKAFQICEAATSCGFFLWQNSKLWYGWKIILENWNSKSINSLSGYATWGDSPKDLLQTEINSEQRLKVSSTNHQSKQCSLVSTCYSSIQSQAHILYPETSDFLCWVGRWDVECLAFYIIEQMEAIRWGLSSSLLPNG
jgi:hypothetical protein